MSRRPWSTRRMMIPAAIDAIENQVVAGGMASQAASQVVSWSTDAGPLSEQVKTFGNRINGPVCGGLAAGFRQNVIPNPIEVGAGLRSEPVCHSAPGYFEAAARERARPRRFTSSASSRIEGSPIGMPSPRATDRSASSIAARISSRRRSRSIHSARASRMASSGRRSRPPATARSINSCCSRSNSICMRIHPVTADSTMPPLDDHDAT